MKTTIEFCTCDETLAADLCDRYDLDHGAWLEEVADEYTRVAVAAAEEAGLVVERAAGQRGGHHGWRGAHFSGRAGIFGWFGTMDRAKEAALDSASAAGYEAARSFAAVIATTTAPE